MKGRGAAEHDIFTSEVPGNGCDLFTVKWLNIMPQNQTDNPLVTCSSQDGDARR